MKRDVIETSISRCQLVEPRTPDSAAASTRSDSPARQRLREARCAVAALFFLNGAIFATWVTRIPALQAQHTLSHAHLGLALLAMAMGAVISMPIAGRMIAVRGSGKISLHTGLAFCTCLLLLALAPGTFPFFASMILFGVAHGALDVAMNAHAVAVEQRYPVPIMASFHALFSTGGLVGAAVGGGVAALGLAPLVHFSLVAALFTVTALIVSPHLLTPAEERAGVPRPPRGTTRALEFRVPGLAALGTVAACIMMGEGAIADWSAVYLRNIRLTSESVAATGYAAFSIAMAAGRFCGDALTARLGEVRLVRIGGILAAAGLSIALLVPGAVATLFGLAAVGLGFSGIVPIVFSAAGRTPGVEPGVALATVTTMGYGGFLIGPPLIGFAAEWIGLPGALGLIAGTSLLSVALARAVRPLPVDQPRSNPLDFYSRAGLPANPRA